MFAGGAVRSARHAVVRRRLGVRRVRAELPITTMARPAGLAICGVLAVVTVGPAAAAFAVAGSAAGGWVVRRRRGRRTERRRGDQLPDATAAIAAGLRGGLSLSQAFAYARDEGSSPLRDDLARLVSAVELGTPIREALDGWADAVGTEDARLIVAVVELHRRSGGDLAAALDGVAATLRERRSAVREIRALTAQARLSGAILGALPIGFFAFLLVTSRREMLDAMATSLGRTAVLVGLGLEVLAFGWIRRLLAVR